MYQASVEGAMIDHQYRVAAYVVTWLVQSGYVIWLAMKWRAQKKDAGTRPDQATALNGCDDAGGTHRTLGNQLPRGLRFQRTIRF